MGVGGGGSALCEKALLSGAEVWEFQKIIPVKGGEEQMEKSV